MPKARNDEQTKQMFTPPLIRAMSVLAKRIYNENKVVVQRIVYGAYSGEFSGRTYDLKRAWVHHAYGGGGHAVGEFRFDPGQMDSHPSPIDGCGGVQAGLIEIVYKGLAGNFGYPPVGPAHASDDPKFSTQAWANQRNAWKELLAVLGAGKMKQFFEEGLASAGLRYRFKGGSFEAQMDNED